MSGKKTESREVVPTQQDPPEENDLPELEELFALLVRALFVTGIDPALSDAERWATYVNFPNLPWSPHPDDLPVEIPDSS